MKHNHGITAIELLIVVAIMSILTVIIASSFSSFRSGSVLTITTENIFTIINEARLNTLSAKDTYEYGVHFESGRVVLFRGSTFTEPDSNNKEYTFDSSVEANPITLTGGASNVVFEKLTGKASATGTVTFILTSDPSTSRTINIYGTGVTDLE